MNYLLYNVTTRLYAAWHVYVYIFTYCFVYYIYIKYYVTAQLNINQCDKYFIQLKLFNNISFRQNRKHVK